MIFSDTKYLLSKTAIIPVVVTILFLVPFVNKAFHVDDSLFLWSAQQIKTDPLNFYDSNVNWYGTEMSMADVTKNPPITSYYIALTASLFGWSEIALHIAFLIPALAAVLGMYYLAKYFCSNPVLAALTVIVTPAFLVSSTNLMCDTMMLSLWVWAMVLWLRGIRDDKLLSLFFAAVLISLCALTKYFGVALLPLLIVYSIVQKRRIGIWVLFLLIPVMVLVTYEYLTTCLYGKGLLWDAVGYATEISAEESTKYFSKGLTGLIFIGGGVAAALFYAPVLWSRRVLLEGGIVTALFIFILIYFGKIGSFPLKTGAAVKWSLVIQIGIWAVSGVSILALIGTDFWKARDADSLLLGLWVLGTFIFAGFINWTVNIRSILPLVPPVAILLMRRIDQRSEARGKTGIWRIAWPLIPAAVITLSVTWADYTLAGTVRRAAEDIQKTFKNHNGTVWFQGHWGFQYYMQAKGGKPYDFSNLRYKRLDVIIIPQNNTNTRMLSGDMVQKGGHLEFSPCRWMTTMTPSLGAGFYANILGPLPFAAGPVTSEKYYVFVFK